MEIGTTSNLPILKSGCAASENVAPLEGSKSKVRITQADIAEEVNYWLPSIVGYVAGANPPLNVFEGFARRIWGEKIVKIGTIAHGVFLVRFESVEMRDAALEGGFIFFDRKPFIMRPWNAIENFAKKDITVVPTWVQARGIEGENHAYSRSWNRLVNRSK